MHKTKRIVCAIALVAGLVICISQTVSAQLPVTDVAALAQLVLQYQRQLQQVLNELQQIQMMTVEATHLGSHPSTSLQADLWQLATILNQAQGLSYNMAQMDQQFRTVYKPYAMGQTKPYYQAYDEWSQLTMNTVRGTLDAAGFQANNLDNEQTFMTQIKGLMQTTVGRNQALEIGNAIGAEEVGQLEKLRQLMYADLLSKGAYMQRQLSIQEAQQQAQQMGLMHGNINANQKAW